MLQSLSAAAFSLVGKLVALALAVVVATTLVQILLRYAFNSPLIWSEEFSKLLIVWITFIGASIACFRKTHLNVDVLLVVLPGRMQKLLLAFNAVLSVGFLLVLGLTSIALVRIEAMQEMSALPLRSSALPLAVTIGAFVMVAALLLRGAVLFLNRTVTPPSSDDLSVNE